jgi:hypothetical protein
MLDLDAPPIGDRETFTFHGERDGAPFCAIVVNDRFGLGYEYVFESRGFERCAIVRAVAEAALPGMIH